MATKSAQSEPEKAEVIEELLDLLDKTLDRVKVLYEQFFLGMQRQPPTHMHTDVERKLRDLTQMHIRNTALRYRFATVQQKFGSYNSYWRRTLRQIENGTYHRNLAKIGRQAALTGEEIPDEILAAMPKRMREQVKRDREIVLAKARRERHGGDGDHPPAEDAVAAPKRNARGAHVIDEGDGDFDLDAYFRSVTTEEATNPDAVAFSGDTPTPVSRSTVRAATFDGEPPTDHDAAIPERPAPAVRAGGIGIRISTPVQGVPTARVMRSPSAAPDDQASRQSGRWSVVDDDAPPPPQRAPFAASQGARPIPVAPGASAQRGAVPVATLAGPFPRGPSAPLDTARTTAIPRLPLDATRTTALPVDPTRRTSPGMARPGTPPPTPPARGHGPPTQLPPHRAASPVLAPPNRALSQPIARPLAAAPPVRAASPAPTKPTRASTEPGAGAPARAARPPGMSDADVNALYAKYVKAKEAVGEKAGPGSYGKLLQTINAQAPKIMEQYKSKGVDFQVVVKDNQVVIRAKPKP